MKKFPAPGFYRVACLLGLLVPALLRAAPLETNFAAAESSLREKQAELFELADRYGRYDPELLEPLQRFAHSQIEVNRYDDAAQTVDYAIQIVRSAEGLDTASQYDLQQLAIEVDLYRQDWEAINERLAYYSNLLINQYRGSVEDRLSRILWLADMHMRGGIEDEQNRHAHHLIRATWYAETAVIYAQVNHLDQSRQYAEMLYALAGKYYLESRAILAGGATSYRLRQVRPGVHIVDDKYDAVDRRYRAGLSQLTQMRDLLASSAVFDAEAVALAELYIADWKALFDKSDELTRDYARAISMLAKTDVPRARFEQFLANPVVIPRARLALSINDALEPGSSSRRRQATDEMMHRVSLIEPANHLPGFAQDLALVNWQGGVSQDWKTVSVTLTLDPDRRRTVRNPGIRTRSRITGSSIEVYESEADQELTARAMRRIATLSFRPAFVKGKAVASDLAVDYLVRASSLDSVTPLVTGHWVASHRVPDHVASLAAAGE